MARPRRTGEKPAAGKRRIEQYDHQGIEAYCGTVSLPFKPGAHKRVAVKILDDRGIESLKIIPVP